MLQPLGWSELEGMGRRRNRFWSRRRSHSVEARVIERFTRVSKNDMMLHITMIAPKLYTQPFVFGTENFRWVPNQQLGRKP